MSGNNLDFLDMLTILSVMLQIMGYQNDMSQSSNDDLMRELQRQDKSYLEKIINNKLNIEDIDTLKEDDKMKSVLRYAFDNYYSDMSLIDFRKDYENV